MKTKILTIAAITVLHSLLSTGVITSGASKVLAEPVEANIDQTPAIINTAQQEFNVRFRLASNTPRSCENLKASLTSKEVGLTSARRPLFQYQGQIFGLEQNDPPTSCLATFKVDSKYKGKVAYLKFTSGNLFCTDVNQRPRDINGNISVMVLEKPMDLKLNCSSRTRR
jgi:hypothetical protein